MCPSNPCKGQVVKEVATTEIPLVSILGRFASPLSVQHATKSDPLSKTGSLLTARGCHTFHARYALGMTQPEPTSSNELGIEDVGRSV